jgi:hypothetical protein
MFPEHIKRRWVGIARLLATAALWVRIQTSLKNAKSAKEWPARSSPPKNIKKLFSRTVHIYDTGIAYLQRIFRQIVSLTVKRFPTEVVTKVQIENGEKLVTKKQIFFLFRERNYKITKISLV